MITRRTLLLGGAGTLAVGAAAATGWELAPYRAKKAFGLTADAYIPDAPEGRVRVDKVHSSAMGREMDLFTAVPAGHGDGAGLPVVVVLHGSSATASGFRAFGFGRFVTEAVRRGAPPFVLAGTDDGPAGWVADGSGPDPQRMVRQELPRWLADRGFDAGRRVLWGWSRGGYGVLRLLESEPAYARAAALFSPALSVGDPVFARRKALAGVPLGFWCGTSDPFYDAVRSLVTRLPDRPEVVTFAEGAHTRVFWNDHTLDAFRWLAAKL